LVVGVSDCYANGGHRAIRGRASDRGLGITGRVDDLGLQIRVVGEYPGSDRKARPIAHAERMVHRDLEAACHGELSPPNGQGLQRSELHTWLVLERRWLQLHRRKALSERAKNFLAFDPRQ
jgi:hypothetical protein